ncbi:MAG: hypothetical protein MGU50_20910, partial [Trichodesmium sp. MAG_R02]|nr:hypothetical protein [Trichodesmium sp. MAG_R02]
PKGTGKQPSLSSVVGLHCRAVHSKSRNARGRLTKNSCGSLFVLSGKKLIIDHGLSYFYSQRAEFRKSSSFDQYL